MDAYNQAEKPDIHGMFEKPQSAGQKLEAAGHVLAPIKYKLRTALMFADFIAIILYVYLVLIAAGINDMLNSRFSFVSRTMLTFYCVLALTAAAIVFVFIYKKDKTAQNRLEKENHLRTDEAVKVWLSGFDWGWPILFVPTMILMAAGGLIGLILNLIAKDASAVVGIQQFIGGVIIVFGILSAAVVIFKLKPKSLAVIAAAFLVTVLLMLLYGTSSLLRFLRFFRHFGVANDPLGYLLLAYVWFVFLRLIWLKSLYYYWVLLPQKFQIQTGLGEIGNVVDLAELRCRIDTQDVILSWFDIGTITFYFPGLDKPAIVNLMTGIHKKTGFISRIITEKTV